MSEAADRRWLDAAARQALPYLGTTGRFATVGAIVVESKTSRLLGRGITDSAGKPAEELALAEAGETARGATVYMTLAPASAETLAAAGIERLVVGTRQSPEPDALESLRQAGIGVAVTDRPLARRLHEGYFSLQSRQRPFVTAVLAVSVDCMAGGRGEGHCPVLDDAARRWRLLQASLSDAVLSSWRSAALVAPRVPLEGLEDRRPLRVVLTGHKTGRRSLADTISVLSQAGPAAVVAIPEKQLDLPGGAELIRVSGNGRPSLDSTLAVLGQRGIQNLLVEAGPTLLEALLAAKVIDRFHLIVAEQTGEAGGIRATSHGGMEARLLAAGFSLVDHRLLGADNLRTFERLLS